MTIEIAFLLALLAVMVYFFMTEILPVELTAFIGLLVLIFAGQVLPEEAFQGFSSPAVMTMFSIFFISAALLETGVADVVAARIHALVGEREVPLIILIMIVAGVLSAFMNNVAAAAVMLPAISSLARQAGLPPGRLFMPLSFGAILGGTTTLVGTPPNILASEVLNNRGIEAFSLFDFAPIGIALLSVGVLFMATVGRRLLPSDSPEKKGPQESNQLTSAYRIEDRLTTIRIPSGSNLDGLNLRDARLGTALDVRVLVVERNGKKIMAPDPDFVLNGEDLLLVDGNYRDLRQLLGVQGISVDETDHEHLQETSHKVRGARLRLRRGSGLVGNTLADLRFRHRFGVLVVGIRRGDELMRQQLAQVPLEQEDRLLVLGSHEQLAALATQKTFEVVDGEVAANELLDERLFQIRVGEESKLVGITVGNSRIGELVGLTVVGILRQGEAILAVEIDEAIQAGDELLIVGDPTRVMDILELSNLELESKAQREDLISSKVSVTEAVVAPRSDLAGKTPREIHFRDRFGLQVLALWRKGDAIHRDLANQVLQFGDALLLHGPRERIHHLTEDPDFVVLAQDAPPRRTEKAPVALGSLAFMIALVASGLYPIHIAAFAGAVTTVLFGALTMEKAYRSIEWRALFLVAAVLPVGNAMESSGAATFLADLVVRVAEPYGTYAFLAALVVLSSILSQGLDGAPTVVILAPVVILTAEQLQVSPRPLMMAVGLAASAAFMTPFSHKANLLVMSAGGYRAKDFVRVGTPLTVVVLALIIFLVPIFFPLKTEKPVLEEQESAIRTTFQNHAMVRTLQ